VSFTAFAITQVCIDCETLYYMIRKDWPPHRQLHSVVGGSVAGLAVAAAVVIGRPAIDRLAAWLLGRQAASPSVSSEATASAAVCGGLLGGSTHAVLDGLCHADGNPWWPFAASSNLYGTVSPLVLHASCVLAGLVAVLWLWWREKARSVVVQ
jgi:hypothetical protein